MNADSKKAAFQQDMIDQMVAGGWKQTEIGKFIRLDQGTPLVHNFGKYWISGRA